MIGHCQYPHGHRIKIAESIRLGLAKVHGQLERFPHYGWVSQSNNGVGSRGQASKFF